MNVGCELSARIMIYEWAQSGKERKHQTVPELQNLKPNQPHKQSPSGNPKSSLHHCRGADSKLLHSRQKRSWTDPQLSYPDRKTSTTPERSLPQLNQLQMRISLARGEGLTAWSTWVLTKATAECIVIRINSDIPNRQVGRDLAHYKFLFPSFILLYACKTCTATVKQCWLVLFDPTSQDPLSSTMEGDRRPCREGTGWQMWKSGLVLCSACSLLLETDLRGKPCQLFV